jgi:hypothetical protein
VPFEQLLAHRAHRSAYFVVARRGKAPLLSSPQHGGRAITDARSWLSSCSRIARIDPRDTDARSWLSSCSRGVLLAPLARIAL